MGRDRWQAHAAITNPGVPSALAVRWLRRFVLPIVRFVHRATLDGTEHLPPTSPFLLVANHPAGVALSELTAFAALYADRFGTSRPLAGFAHAVSFRWFPLSKVFPHIGAIPSTYAAAETTLEAGVPIVLFPGGDHEGFRPFWQANRVDFGGRLGFLRIARKAWVPIVPMGFRGVTAPLLFRSRVLPYLFVWPRLVGIKRYGLSVSAVLGMALILGCVPLSWPFRALLACAWAASPLALASWWPARIRIRIGAPMPPETLFGDRASRAGDDAVLVEALAKVEHAVQSLVDAPSRER
jgi:1-acyl-sn-glycerol-3-phosphate acyltransferase